MADLFASDDSRFDELGVFGRRENVDDSLRLHEFSKSCDPIFEFVVFEFAQLADFDIGFHLRLVILHILSGIMIMGLIKFLSYHHILFHNIFFYF